MNAPDTLIRPDPTALAQHVAATWDRDIVRELTDYIAIPAKSPMFDADWAKNGHIERVVRDAAQWVESRKVPGLTLEVVRLPGRTPVIFFEIAGTKTGSTDTVVATATSTSSLNSPAGATTWGRGRPSTKTASCTGAAAPTTVTRCTPPLPPCRR